ncbi:MAG: hypothetical protein KDD61_11495 [Bdellovibrionales bacterium]|nr:hypothetical protein [Bdellovibrionales bacterium]
MARTLLIFLVSIGWISTSLSMELFSSAGSPVANYGEQVFLVEPGTVLNFSATGMSFQVERILNPQERANLTVVYSLGNGEALRLAAHRYRTPEPQLSGGGLTRRSRFRHEAHFEMDAWDTPFGANSMGNEGLGLGLSSEPVKDIFLDAMLNFQTGWEQVQSTDLPVVLVNEDRSRSPFYFVVEEVDVKFLADEAFRNWSEVRKVYPQVEEHWLQFVSHTWEFVKLGDFKLSQLAYDGERWVLLDLWKDNERINKYVDIEQGSVFDVIDEDKIPRLLRAQMFEVIRDRRRLELCEAKLR